MTIEERKKKEEQIRKKMWRKAICFDFNLETIQDTLCDIEEVASGIQYTCDSEIEDILEDILGSYDDAREFKILFSNLEYYADRLRERLCEEWVPDCFDDIFVLVAGNNESLKNYGWVDEYGDFMAMPDWDQRRAGEEAQKRLERFTKKEIIEAVQTTFDIAIRYIELRNRFDDLNGAMEIVKGNVCGQIEMVKTINKLYESAYSGEKYNEYERFGLRYETKEMIEYDKFLNNIDPYDRMWIE